MTIFNKYKDILKDFINSLDIKSFNKLIAINKLLHNMSKFKSKLLKARLKLENDFLDKNLLNK